MFTFLFSDVKDGPTSLLMSQKFDRCLSRQSFADNHLAIIKPFVKIVYEMILNRRIMNKEIRGLFQRRFELLCKPREASH